MKKYIIAAVAVMGMVSLTSCEDFLDSSNYTEANSSNYPASPADLNKELAALYGVMNQYANDPLQTPWMVWNIMSDDANGGGGTGDIECHAIGHLMSSKAELYDTAWKSTYVGIARANAIISSVDAFNWTGNEKTRNQLLGEAYFMRGLFYLWGTQFWGDIPAYWEAAAPDPCPQVSAKEVIYPHILADFVSASELMSHGATTWGDGHAMKGTAEGYLARAYMFYQGFYNNVGELASANPAPVELPEQEGVSGALTKDMVINYLTDCINNSGAELISDYRLLWQYSNELTANPGVGPLVWDSENGVATETIELPGYAYVKDLADQGKYWAGNGNKEQLFQVQFGNMASWTGTIGMGFTNMTELYCGLRCDDDGNGNVNGFTATLPFGQGWGQGVFNMNSVNDWSASDPRKAATVLDCEKELEHFVFTTSCSEETGMYNKKWIAVTCPGSSWYDQASYYTWWGVYRNSNTSTANTNGNSFQGDHFSDIVLLRLSDVMLMHSELTGTADMMNRVQERAGVAKTGYSWQNIKNERRWELYGEGIRFNDLRRWSGYGADANCEAAKALEAQNGSAVNYTGRWTTMKQASVGWAQRYAQTQGFLPIPPGQINIVADESVLKQNPGWTSAEQSAWNMASTPVY